MRKILVKNFVLDYFFKIFNTTFNAPRASRIIFPLFAITGIMVALNPEYPKPSIALWIMYGITATAVFFGFVYFRYYPAKWEELDFNQKFQMGYFDGAKLTEEQHKEWLLIVKKYKDEHN